MRAYLATLAPTLVRLRLARLEAPLRPRLLGWDGEPDLLNLYGFWPCDSSRPRR